MYNCNSIKSISIEILYCLIKEETSEMLHFLTGFYYFTWFENLLIIIAGLSLGHFLSLIARQVQLIRHHRPLTRTLTEMAPWFVILLVLMLSPVFASGIAVGWMVIIGLLECVVEYLITLKLKQSRPAKSHVRQKTQHHKPAVEEFSDDDFDDADGDSVNEINLYNHDTDRFDDTDISSDRPASHAVSHMTQTPHHDQSSAEPVSRTANDAAPTAESSSSQTSQAAQSAPESQAEQVPATSANTSSSAPTASHQPTSQEMMDHMFDFDPNVDYEATAKSDTSAASDDQSASETQVASSAPAVSEQPSSQEAMDHVFDFDPNVNYEAEAASAAKANEQSEANNGENNN